jgi:hypothetical protein
MSSSSHSVVRELKLVVGKFVVEEELEVCQWKLIVWLEGKTYCVIRKFNHIETVLIPLPGDA